MILIKAMILIWFTNVYIIYFAMLVFLLYQAAKWIGYRLCW